MSVPRRNGGVGGGFLDPFASLVQLAVGSDDSVRLIAAAGAELRRPLGLASAGGEELAHAPDDDEGRRAMAVARAAARHGLVAPPGWNIVALGGRSAPLGFLAVGGERVPNLETHTLLDLLPALLTDQLKRVALSHAQRAALVRELVSNAHVGIDQVRREAAELGLRLADTYWPGLLVWRNVPPSTKVLQMVERCARSLAEDSLAVALDGRMVLLHPSDLPPGRDTLPRDWFEELARTARKLHPSSQAQAIACEAPAGLSALSARVAALEEYLRFGPRAEGGLLVVSGAQFALDRLLWENIDPLAAARFVDAQLGGLIEWDRRHRSSLVMVLEAWMDFPRCDRAAAKCFMHRNTFRHRLRQAQQVLGTALEDPDTRLAVHVALKLRRLLGARSGGDAGGHNARSRSRASALSREAGSRRATWCRAEP